jgi:hypothetical protein
MRLEHIHSYVFMEDLDAKIPELMKQFKNVPPEEAEKKIREIAEADPTEGKIYTPWLIRQVLKNNIRLPEDQDRALGALRLFDQGKRVAAFPGPKDINAYKIFQDLEAVTDKLQGTELKSKRQSKREVKEKGARLAYDDGKYSAIEITDPEAAVIYSKGSKWCTSSAGTASHYLKQGPLFILFKDEEKFAQLHAPSGQLMDLTDRSYDWANDSGLRKMLSNIIKPTNPQASWFLTRVSGKRIPEAEIQIAQDVNLSVDYAIDVVKGRWPAAEPALLDSVRKGNYYGQGSPIKYAAKAIGGRWPELEKALESTGNAHMMLEYVLTVVKERVPSMEPSIINTPDQAVRYAASCIKGRWPEAEDKIVAVAQAATAYAKNVLGQRWPRFEAILLNNSGDQQNPYNIMHYIDAVIKDRWPEAEPIIAKSPQMLPYAEKYVKGPWPEVESAIMRSNSENIFKYITNVLKAPWPRFESAILKALGKLQPSTEQWRDVARLAFKYSRDVKNGSWPEAEALLAGDPDFIELYRNNITLRRAQ